MTDDEVHSALVRWLADTLSVRVIRDHEGGARPQLPYVMANFLGSVEVRDHAQRIEYSSARPDPADVVATPVLEIEWRFSVHAYGPTPTDILRPLRSASRLSQVIEPMLPRLNIFEMSQIRNVPDWVNERWEPRAQLDIMLRGLTRDGFIIDTIDDMDVNIDRRG